MEDKIITKVTGNGTNKWVIGVLFSVLICLIAFLGGNQSAMRNVNENRTNIASIKMDISVLIERTNNQALFNNRIDGQLSTINNKLDNLNAYIPVRGQ